MKNGGLPAKFWPTGLFLPLKPRARMKRTHRASTYHRFGEAVGTASAPLFLSDQPVCAGPGASLKYAGSFGTKIQSST